MFRKIGVALVAAAALASTALDPTSASAWIAAVASVTADFLATGATDVAPDDKQQIAPMLEKIDALPEGCHGSYPRRSCPATRHRRRA
jgi:hypothetical protein